MSNGDSKEFKKKRTQETQRMKEYLKLKEQTKKKRDKKESRKELEKQRRNRAKFGHKRNRDSSSRNEVLIRNMVLWNRSSMILIADEQGHMVIP